MAKRLPNIHGSRVYNLTSGATLPSWLSERRKRELSKDLDFRRRIELVQDLEFPTSCQRLKVSRDGQYIVAAGGYPPSVRIFDLADLSLKVERRLDCAVTDLAVLSDDYSKLVFLQADRHLEFHAAYGRHFRCRIPRFGRCVRYHASACELLVAGAGDEVYRLDLSEGRFKAPLHVPNRGGVNALAVNMVHGLVAGACESGEVICFDPRIKNGGGSGGVNNGGGAKHGVQAILGILDVLPGVINDSPYAVWQAQDNAARRGPGAESGVRATAVAFDEGDALTLGVGTSTGHVMLYDLRSSKPLAVKEHPNGLPINHIFFHAGQNLGGLDGRRKIVSEGWGEGSSGNDALSTLEMSTGGLATRCVVSADVKVVKVWSRDHVINQGRDDNGMNAKQSHGSFDLKHQRSSSAPNSGGGRGKERGVVGNMETPADVNDVCVVRDRRGDTGLLLVAAEQERVLSYYIPDLGPAPRWCSFLDAIVRSVFYLSLCLSV
jgi:WD40 repeat protein